MAATYDGLTFALIVWVIVLLARMIHGTLSCLVGIPISIVLAIFVLICLREARRFVIYQIEELVATIAAVTARK